MRMLILVMFLLFCLNQVYQLRSKPIELRILPIIYFAIDELAGDGKTIHTNLLQIVCEPSKIFGIVPLK